MDYTEIFLKVKNADCEVAAAVANMAVPYGIYIEDYSDMEETLSSSPRVDYIDDALLSMDKSFAKIHIYIPADQSPNEAISFIETRLRESGVWYELGTSKALENVFMNEWKKYYKPERIGERLIICPSWERFEAAGEDIVISLDPETAFGTGKHETTRLCLEIIEKTVKGGERVLDMGTGSGILAIAASKLRASEVTAVDIEENSVKIAALNAKKNDAAITTLCGDILFDKGLYEKVGGGYDLITANIVADVIIAMGGMFYDKLNVGGTLIISGIIDSRRDEVLNKLKELSFKATEVVEDGGWVAASLTK